MKTSHIYKVIINIRSQGEPVYDFKEGILGKKS